MKVLNYQTDIEHGFAFIQVEGNNEQPLTVQCCLMTDAGKFTPKILMSDCGQDQGLCADANEAAFDFYGENRCMKALFAHAEANGVSVA